MTILFGLLAVAGWAGVLFLLRRPGAPAPARSRRSLFKRLLISRQYVVEEPPTNERADFERQIEAGRRAHQILELLGPELQNAYRNVLIELHARYETLEGDQRMWALHGKVHTFVELEDSLQAQVLGGDQAFQQLTKANEPMEIYRLG